MYLLVGLGNPGSEYSSTRHNIGFMAVEEIASHFKFSPWRSKFHSLIAEGAINNEKVLALLPQTFMNTSGKAVAEAAQFFKIQPQNIIVIHDELDLQPAKVRVKRGGGAAGHNGLRSIDQTLDPNYWRIRIGIGHPGNKDAVSEFVLHPFSKAERVWLDPLLRTLAEKFPLMIAGQPDAFAGQVAADLA